MGRCSASTAALITEALSQALAFHFHVHAQHLVADHAHGKDVRVGSDCAGHQTVGARVAHGAHANVFVRQLAPGQGGGDASQVQQRHVQLPVVWVDHHALRLQVAVHKTFAVHDCEPFKDAHQERDRVLCGEGPWAEERTDGDARDVVHDAERLAGHQEAGLTNLHHPGGLDPRQRHDLRLKALLRLHGLTALFDRVEHFDGAQVAGLAVGCRVDGADALLPSAAQSV